MKKMRSKTAIIEQQSRARRCSGQAVTEYVLFLAVTLMLMFGLFFLMRAVSGHGELTVERVGYSVP